MSLFNALDVHTQDIRLGISMAIQSTEPVLVYIVMVDGKQLQGFLEGLAILDLPLVANLRMIQIWK